MAFSLRDFIYSQDLPQSFVDVESGTLVDSPPNLPLPIPFGHSLTSPLLSPPIVNAKETIEDVASSDDVDEDKPKRAVKKKRFKIKQAKKPPVPKMQGKQKSLYESTPQLADATKINRSNHFSVIPFLCGQQDYLLFPQRHGPLLADLRHNTRDLFNRCFEGKDFVGALQSLRCLNEVDAVFYDDVAKLLEIVSILPAEHAALQNIANHFSTVIPRKLDSEIKSNLVQTIAHLLVGQGDYSNAKAFIKSNRSRTVASHLARLLALDSTIVLLQLLSLASEAVTVMQLPTIPLAAEELFLQPAWIFFSVRLLEHLASGGSSSLFEEGSDLRPRCKAILNEITVSLASSAFRAEAYDWPSFQFLYLSILAGQRDGIKAHEQIIAIQQRLFAQQQEQDEGDEQEGLSEQERQTIKANYCDVMIRYCILFGERDENHIQDLTQLCYQLLKASNALHLSQDKQCYLALFSLMHTLIPRSECLQTFANTIESLSHGNFGHMSDHARLKEKLLWRILAALLGPLPYAMTNEEAVSSKNAVQMFIPEMVVANGLFANGSKRMRYHITRAVQDEDDDQNDYHQRFGQEREWWMDFILSPCQLDDLSDALIEADIESLLALLEEDLDVSEMTSLPALKLYHQEPKSFLNRWKACEEQFSEAEIHVDMPVAAVPMVSKDKFDDNFAPPLSQNIADTLTNLDINVLNELLSFCVDDHTFLDPILELGKADLRTEEGETYLDHHFSLDKETIDIPVWFLSNKQGYTRSNVWSGRVHRQETVIVLGKGRLETLTYQALIAAHLQDQDCLFTIRVVQILCRHAIMQQQGMQVSEAALICLAFLQNNEINIRRAVAKGAEFACRDVPMDEAPAQYFKGPPDEIYLSGNLHAHYQPVPFTSTT